MSSKEYQQLNAKLTKYKQSYHPSAPTSAPKPKSKPQGTYTVRMGDNLGAIAMRYSARWPAGTTLWGNTGAVEQLAKFNGIKSNVVLPQGKVLKLPW